MQNTKKLTLLSLDLTTFGREYGFEFVIRYNKEYQCFEITDNNTGAYFDTCKNLRDLKIAIKAMKRTIALIQPINSNH